MNGEIGWHTGSRLIRVGRVEPSPEWHMSAASHTHHELIVIIRGAMLRSMGGTDVRGASGDVFYYPAGMVHEEWSDPAEPVETIYLVFDHDRKLRGDIHHLHDESGRLRQIVRWLYLEWPQHAVGSGALCETFFNAALLEWDRLVSISAPALIEHTRRFIRERIGSHIDLEALCASNNMSKYHFVRTYKKLSGRTPMEDVRAERVRHAQHLIVHTDLPLKDIAVRSGLCDECHLSHLIRRYLNVTPGELRSSLR